MKINFCIFLVSLISFACSNFSENESDILPSEEEIQEVIKTIILKDSLDAKFPIQSEIESIKIWYSQKNDSLPPPPIKGLIRLNGLVVNTNVKSFLFHYVDTAFIKLQETDNSKIVINSISLKNRTFIYTESNEKGNNNIYYRFFKPIFSENKLKAYLMLDYMCSDCGGGREYFLAKNKNKWEIVFKRTTWRN